MDTLTEVEFEIIARKEALRERDRRLVAEGKATWDEINEANTFGASVVRYYSPSRNLGLKPR